MNARNGIILGLLVTALAGFGFYHFALKPKQVEADGLQGQIDQQQQQLDTAKGLLASNEKARQNYRNAYASVIRLGKAVPADDDVRSLVVQIESAARKAKIDFSSINLNAGGGAGATTSESGAAVQLPPGATVGPAGFPVMQFSFTFKGQFFKLGDFFQRLQGFVTTQNEKLRVTGRLMAMDTLKLEPDSTGFPKIQATVNATTYLVSPLEGLTAGATAAGPAGTAAATTEGSTAPASGSTSAAAITAIPHASGGTR